MSDPLNKPVNETETVTNAESASAAAASTDGGAAQPQETRVAGLEQEISALKDQLLRALAEVENVRRRGQRDREDIAKFAVASFAKELLPVADNLRRALEAVPLGARETDEMVKNLAVGVEATERQLLGAFDRVGIRKLEPVGELFDPNFHQVMFEIENTGKAAGTVVQMLQAGYTLNGRLLREAMVGVAKRGTEEAAQQHIDTKA
ncbi:MAG: nucleotide exchange factor GrpE [Rhodospirillaceae bacterium]